MTSYHNYGFFRVSVEPKLVHLGASNDTNITKYTETLQQRNRILKLYSTMVIVGSLLTFVRSFSNFYFCTKAGRKLHKVLIAGVLNASMVFFDNHLVGNILNRVSKDFHTIDEVIPYVVYENFRVSFELKNFLTGVYKCIF